MKEDLAAQIERYNRELLRFRERSQLPPEPTQPEPTQPDTVQPDTVQPEPTQPEPVQPDEPPAQMRPQTPPPPIMDDVARLRVRVIAADEAIPLPGVSVLITQRTPDGEVLVFSLVTDRSGLTPFVELPTVDRDLSLSPGNPQPYAVYDVEVSEEGFYPVRNENVPLFGGISATQTAALIPLAEQADPDTVLVYPETGAADLG